MRPLPSRCLAAFLVLLALDGTCGADAKSDAREEFVELYKSNKLFDKAQLKAVRAAATRLFEKEHADLIRRAYGDDHDELAAWLDAHPAVKETFYTALDARHDRLDKALGLFRQIWKASPEKLERFAHAATAVAVTWDNERGIYDYEHHQERTKSRMPEGLVDALGNFRYLVDHEAALEGRAQLLPWELLVFVVDHRTPVRERLWAHEYYKTSRGRVSSWHQDVPYDKEMLRTERSAGIENSRTKLAGRDYSLSNIKQYGGVCAQQADFAARVGKSVCIPAAYCRGQSAYRGWHAWWMYVQVQKSGGQTRYVLLSDGRYFGFTKDLFYTGTVIDPQTGKEVLDRDLERRLGVFARDPAATRHARLVMRVYPWLSERLGVDTKGKVSFLDRVLKLSVHDDAAWAEVSALVKRGELKAEQKQVVMSHLSSVSRTCADYPDFVHRLVGDLAHVQADPKERVKLYEQAATMFERGRRPDLACDTRLKITDHHCSQEKFQAAAQGLIATIRKFPTEGRFIPRMTAKLQEVSGRYKGGDVQLARLYLELVPAMMTFYGGDDTQYADSLLKQAKRYLEENNLSRYATELQARTDRARLLSRQSGR